MCAPWPMQSSHVWGWRGHRMHDAPPAGGDTAGSDSPYQPRRVRREARTIAAMVRIYCHDQHRTAEGLCGECSELVAYASRRLEKCRFGADKPTCVNCPVHCYKPEMRERVRVVMRYSGPRMIKHHPVLAAAHLLDNKKAPEAK